jgi:hypothetical protein
LPWEGKDDVSHTRHPPDTVAPFATAFDNSMRSCLGRISQDISDAQWMQAGLPLSMGGLGLTHTARVSSAAFIGSAEYSCAVVLDLVPVTSCALGPDISLDRAQAHYHAVNSVGLGDRRGCDECKELLENEQWLAL